MSQDTLWGSFIGAVSAFVFGGFFGLAFSLAIVPIFFLILVLAFAYMIFLYDKIIGAVVLVSFLAGWAVIALHLLPLF